MYESVNCIAVYDVICAIVGAASSNNSATGERGFPAASSGASAKDITHPETLKRRDIQATIVRRNAGKDTSNEKRFGEEAASYQLSAFILVPTFRSCGHLIDPPQARSASEERKT
jgi:hypothetical protein